MVGQSDWLPMIMATFGGSVWLMRCSRSGYYIRYDLVFNFNDLVLDRQLLLLHSLNAKLVTANLNHCIDGGVEVFVLMAQTRHQHAKLRLFLIGHAVSPLNPSCRRLVRLWCHAGAPTIKTGVTGSYPC